MTTANYAFLRALTRVANVCLLTATSSDDGHALNIRVAEGEPVPWRAIGVKDHDLDDRDHDRDDRDHDRDDTKKRHSTASECGHDRPQKRARA